MVDIPEFYAKDQAAWRAWLQKNHDKEKAVWLIYDKGANRKLPWQEIVREALCFGWVDSKAGTVSETQSKIYISRRNPKSGWSKINRENIAQLTKQKRMQPAGLQAVKIARQNGAWDLLKPIEDMVMPQELTAQLAKNQQAKTNFDTFSDSSKRMILFWIYSAKRDNTRANRIAKTVELAEQNIKAA